MIGEELLTHIKRNLQECNIEDFNNFIKLLKKYNRIFITGSGRSEFIGRCFVSKLIHIGKDVYFIGDEDTSAINKTDLLIAISSTGMTQETLQRVQNANNIGIFIISINSNKNNPMSNISDYTIKIPNIETKHNSIMLNAFFELTTIIYLEDIITTMVNRESINEKNLNKLNINRF